MFSSEGVYKEFISLGLNHSNAIKLTQESILGIINTMASYPVSNSWSDPRGNYHSGFSSLMRDDAKRKQFIKDCMNDEFFIKNILDKGNNPADETTNFIKCIDRYNVQPSQNFLDITIKGKISALKNSGFINNPVPNYSNRDYFRQAEYILKFDDSLDCKAFSKKLLQYSKQYSFYYCSGTLQTCLSKWAKEDYKDFYKSVVADAKSRGKDVRKIIYCGAIMSGKADRKLMRRVRSDASEQTSISCVQKFFEYKNSYNNFSELCLYITDTNYYIVADYLADNLPTNMLSSLMGSPFSGIKNTIERRIRQEEEEKQGA